MTNAWDSHGSCSLFGIFVFPQFSHTSRPTRLLSLNCWFAFSSCLSQRILIWVQRNFCCALLLMYPHAPVLNIPTVLRDRPRSSLAPPAPWGKVGLASSAQGGSSWAHGHTLGGDMAFEEGQQAKAVQLLVRWGSVLLPSWTLCVVLLPPPENGRC